jgi:UDP-2,3-diacylglucosamine pyrophosphatase LpxH
LGHDAFRHAFRAIGEQACNAGSQNVELVLLGDVFDMVRTTFWFTGIPEDERPWGQADQLQLTEVCQNHALTLLKRIYDWNQAGLDCLEEGQLRSLMQLPPECQLAITYLPGNHDRLCNQFAAIRAATCQYLHMPASTEPFPVFKLWPEYRAFGRHGHEWDRENFRGTSLLNEVTHPTDPALLNDYLQIPIGEMIACEFASKLPGKVGTALRQAGVRPNFADAVEDRLKVLDDVRPLQAVLPWIVESVGPLGQQASRVLQAIEAGVLETLDELLDLQLVRQLDTVNPFELIDGFRYGGWAIKALGLANSQRILDALTATFGSVSIAKEVTRYQQCAMDDLHRLDTAYPNDPPYLYVLNGHTHQSEQTPLALSPDSYPRYYLNTGTWRPHAAWTARHDGFARWRQMTVTLLYNREIDPGSQAHDTKVPVFETWEDSLLDFAAFNLRQPLPAAL